jgi:hypothetical protein
VTIPQTKMLMEIIERLDKIIELLQARQPVPEIKIPKNTMSDASAEMHAQLACGILNGQRVREVNHEKMGYLLRCNICGHRVEEGVRFTCPNR